MAKENKKENKVIQGSLDEKYLIQKSNPLLRLWSSELTLSEFKIIDTYLSRINSHCPEERTVQFSKGEFESLVGVDKINRSVLDERLEHLRATGVDIGDGKNIDRISLFERAKAYIGEDGLSRVELTCTPSASKYIFDIEKMGYVRYCLRSVLKITSRHSYVMFSYILANKFRKTWDISPQTLREILGCDTKSYQQYKLFNSCILKKVQNEIIEKTGIDYEYEPIYVSRTVEKIRFSIKHLPPELFSAKYDLIEAEYEVQKQDEQTQMAMDFGSYQDNDSMEMPERHRDDLRFLVETCKSEFTVRQIQVLYDILIKKPLPKHENDTPPSRIFAMAEFLRTVYLEFKEKQESQSGIEKPYLYFKKMLANADPADYYK